LDKLGPQLIAHNGHGYSSWDSLEPTLKVVRGRTVVGIYFSADWCTQCVQFTPLLMSLHASHRAHGTAAAKSIPPFKVILVLQCPSEVVLCPILYCIDVFSTYLGKILDFVVVHWSFIFVSHVSRLIVEFI
jgi:hypothetical protein